MDAPGMANGRLMKMRAHLFALLCFPILEMISVETESSSTSRYGTEWYFWRNDIIRTLFIWIQNVEKKLITKCIYLYLNL